ncbi:MAG: tetratricopeptide repeat protein [Pedobacter sp.]|nr:MAG: tetratricopeptide repeat protein [Pedobacter sp.]
MRILTPLTVLMLSISACELSAQSNITLQNAFQNSYIEEGKKDYAKAVSFIIPFNADGNYETNIRIGWLYYLAKNYSASQNHYSRAVNIRPKSIEAKLGLIKPLSLLNRLDKVLEQYNAILKIDPENKQANYWAGVIIYNKKQYTLASKYFAKIVGAYPFDYDGNHMLGWSLLLSGRKEEAKGCFERALLIKPSDFSCTDGLNLSKK